MRQLEKILSDFLPFWTLKDLHSEARVCIDVVHVSLLACRLVNKGQGSTQLPALLVHAPQTTWLCLYSVPFRSSSCSTALSNRPSSVSHRPLDRCAQVACTLSVYWLP